MDELMITNLVNSAVKDTGASAKLYKHLKGHNYLFCDICVDENMTMLIAINTERITITGTTCRFTIERDGKKLWVLDLVILD